MFIEVRDQTSNDDHQGRLQKRRKIERVAYQPVGRKVVYQKRKRDGTVEAKDLAETEGEKGNDEGNEKGNQQEGTTVLPTCRQKK